MLESQESSKDRRVVFKSAISRELHVARPILLWLVIATIMYVCHTVCLFRPFRHEFAILKSGIMTYF